MLMKKSRSARRATIARRTVAAAFVAGASTLVAGAQVTSSNVSLPAPQLVASVSQPLNLATTAAVNYSSSTSSTSVDTTEEAKGLDLSGIPGDALLQPAPRRRYGRPRYNDSRHNPDGSDKYAFVLGVGFGTPVQDFKNYATPSYSFQVGAGRNFNKNFALLFQFDYDNFSFQGNTLINQLNLYNYEIGLYNASPTGQSNPSATLGSLDGSNHIFSFTLNPQYTIYSGQGLGAYVVGGVGFYHKVANFTTPTTGVAYDPYYGYYTYQANQTIDHYFSNAPGVSGGLGLTFKPSRFAGERIFVEARYVYMYNSQRTGVSYATITNPPAGADLNNNYAPNSNRTAYLPVKVGIRF